MSVLRIWHGKYPDNQIIPFRHLPNVLVDQQGYAAVGEKQAVVKGRQSVETFRLVDRETGETVYEGTVKQTDYNGELSLYIGTADFTDYTGKVSSIWSVTMWEDPLTFSLKEDHYQELLEALCTDVHDRCQDRSITEDEIITLLEACEWYPQVLADDNGNDIPDLLESIADWLEKTANDTEKPEPENMCYVAVMAKNSVICIRNMMCNMPHNVFSMRRRCTPS